MRPLLAASILVFPSMLHAQAPVERLRLLATRGDTALLGAVRARPEDARELARSLLTEAGSAASAGEADVSIASARRLADAYAAAWQDSFPARQVQRFAGMTAAERSAKLAADSVRRAGNAALARRGVAPALALWRRALRRSAAIADSAGMAAALGNIGVGHYRAGALDSAAAALARARALAGAVGDRRTALNAIGTLASVAKERGDLREARQLYLDALPMRQRIGDVRGAASDHNNLGLIDEELGDWAAARASYGRALELARTHDLSEPAAAALLNLGNVASREGEFAEASRRYHEALATWRALGHDGDVALVLHNLGLLAIRRGDYRAARARLAEAAAIYARVGTAADRVQVLRDLASVSAAAGDLRAALATLRRAEVALASVDDDDLAAGVALARADLAVQLNDLAAAEHFYARAARRYRRAGNDAGSAEARQGAALLLIERGRFGAAIGQLDGVARVQEAAGDRRSAALTRLLLAHARRRQGDLRVARRTIEQARDTLHALRDVAGEAAALYELGSLELDAGAPLAAEAAFRGGLARLAERPMSGMSWQLRAGLGRALRARGSPAEAADAFRAALAEVEGVAGTLTLESRRAAFLADKWDVYADLALLERARGDADAAFQVNERARARQMLDLLARGRVASPPRGDSALASREQDLRRLVGELTERLAGQGRDADVQREPDLGAGARAEADAVREALARAQEEYGRLLLELREHDSDVAPVARGVPVGWREVARRLRPGEAMLEYLLADSASLVFVVTRDTLRVVDLGVGRRTLASLVDFTRGALARPTAARTRAWRAPLRRLHRQLVEPVEASGALDGVRRLIVVPQAELHYVPFAALVREGARDEFLVERYEIGYAPSASVWVRLGGRAAATNGRVLALAPRPAGLPASADEVAEIRALYGRDATALTGAPASESAFRAMAAGHEVVHLATYGVLNKHNPLFSFVTLNAGGGEDGRLEVHEVFGLGLNARLLVLSACQTGVGSGAVADVPAGDDWVGLVHAFLAAGASNVAATLWPVEDRSTARLMVSFHERLRAGDGELAALAAAQRRALRNPATADPFYWGGFVVVGGSTDGGRR